jgi:hypothetical protein
MTRDEPRMHAKGREWGESNAFASVERLRGLRGVVGRKGWSIHAVALVSQNFHL